MDPRTGALAHVQTLANVTDPSYLTLAPNARFLYAVNELDDDGGVSAFAVDAASGRLQPLNRVASHGADPAHLSVDPTGRWCLVANYTGGTIASFPIHDDGSLGEAAEVVHHTGSGPNEDRQAGPHPHMIRMDPGGSIVLVADLGLDRVLGYRLDLASGRLSLEPEAGAHLAPGAGPRHLAFSPTGRHVYVIDELDSTVSVFDYDSGSSRMRVVETVSTLPSPVSGNTAAAIVIHPSGRFVYASNRGHDSIAAFGVDPANGRLTPLGHTSTGGRTPRDINIDPDGVLLLAANQDSDSITTFHIDTRSGALEPTANTTHIAKPVRVLIDDAAPRGTSHRGRE